MNNTSVLVQALPIIAKSIGSNMGVRVEVDAGKARTDGNVIYLPALPVTDPDVETLGLGLLIHEAGHIRYGDFSEEFYQAHNASIPLARALHGAMEDIRMESCVIRDYPGAHKRLSELVAKLVNDAFFKPVASDENPAAVLHGYVLFRLRAYFLGQTALTAYADNVRLLLEDLVTPLAMTRIDSVLARVVQARNEREVLTLAQGLTLVLEEEIKRQTPPQQPQSNDDSQQSDDSDDSTSSDTQANQTGDEDDGEQSQDSTSSKSDSNDGDTDTDGEGDSPQGESQDSDGSSDGNDAQPSSSQDDGGMSDEDVTKAKATMQDMLDSDDDSGKGDLSEAFQSLVQNEISEAGRKRGNYPVSSHANTISSIIKPGDHQKALDEAQAATAALRTRMTRLVQSQAKAQRKTSRHGRRLNDRKINRVAVGNSSVFKSVSKKKAVNTAVQILADVSGSMHKIIELAMQSTLSTTAALKAIPHLSVGSALFPGYDSCSVTELTSHEQSIQQTAGYYPVVRTHGSTPLLPALVWSGTTLSERKESRKILIVITDGDPDDVNNCEEMLNILRKNGIEVYGLGLGVAQSVMATLFGESNSQVIDSVGELAGATFSLLENTLYKAA